MAAATKIEPLTVQEAFYWSLLTDLKKLMDKPDFRDEFLKWKEGRDEQ